MSGGNDKERPLHAATARVVPRPSTTAAGGAGKVYADGQQRPSLRD